MNQPLDVSALTGNLNKAQVFDDRNDNTNPPTASMQSSNFLNFTQKTTYSSNTQFAQFNQFQNQPAVNTFAQPFNNNPVQLQQDQIPQLKQNLLKQLKEQTQHTLIPQLTNNFKQFYQRIGILCQKQLFLQSGRNLNIYYKQPEVLDIDFKLIANINQGVKEQIIQEWTVPSKQVLDNQLSQNSDQIANQLPIKSNILKQQTTNFNLNFQQNISQKFASQNITELFIQKFSEQNNTLLTSNVDVQPNTSKNQLLNIEFQNEFGCIVFPFLNLNSVNLSELQIKLWQNDFILLGFGGCQKFLINFSKYDMQISLSSLQKTMQRKGYSVVYYEDAPDNAGKILTIQGEC